MEAMQTQGKYCPRQIKIKPEIRLVRLEEEHVLNILGRSEAGERMLSYGLKLDELAASYLSEGSCAYTLLKDDEPIMCGGIVNLKWQRGEGWILVSDLFSQYKKTCLKTVKIMLPFLAKQMKLRRLQALVAPEVLDKTTYKWMTKKLGFKKEGLLRCYGFIGEHYFIFSKVFLGD